MARRVRDLQAERSALRAAAEQLLTSTPPQSARKLTATALISASGLRRDVVYRDHRDLIEDFRTRARTLHATPAGDAHRRAGR